MDKPMAYNFIKVDNEKIRRNKIREFILNHQNLSALRQSQNSYSSGS